MSKLSNIGTIKDIVNRYGFSFSKALGQNFLINPSVCPRIAEMGNARPGFGIIEIGTGIGVLTAELAQRADKVVCIELDSRLLPVLDETLSEFDNIKVINDDVLKVDLKKLIADEFAGMQVAVCANLPYYITSPILMSLLEQRLPIVSITVMVQKEAAVRICAKPGSRECGALSLAVSYYSEPKQLFSVSRGSFLPAPDVDSAVIRLDVRESPAIQVPDEKALFAIIKAGFSQRRKTIVNALSSGLGLPKEEVSRMLERAQVSPKARAEQLTLEDFGRIRLPAEDDAAPTGAG
ncbi:16S rRNA (adenine(1518)-N(6)/adenine(1519)-N(6))-dimethyltransferase RsmA [Zongyangia hominis]|uniref:Ribosomal RNA small subunit methyltransferase A n=1 Tax=Zongyangia hominis TaxID=2763677 RepID=A0A926I7D2_9FIRM|nr:16S rRNA (adenine(1518)-N(6)/adenine(1519)-N(6))-dimethyltransferase RsmA [Zongyangia hominis]MBC8570974.1 16S rRNA (adenine(1518)-N(6)/adenine(1519)-N(6))-dimethyltransferase RsmA [Zongyangia hominis]